MKESMGIAPEEQIKQKEISPEEKKEITKQELINQLTSHGIDINKYGKGEAKTIDHLVKEIIEGEMVLTENNKELMRQITVASANVYHQKPETNQLFHLVEERQVFKDGRVKKRTLDSSISEKIKPGENVDEAIKRAIQEELNINGDIKSEKKEIKKYERMSNSYPDLKTEYSNHYYDIYIQPDQFTEQGYIEHQKDKDNYFIWEESK